MYGLENVKFVAWVLVMGLFLDAFAKLRKATINFVMTAVRLSVRLHGGTLLPLEGFSRDLIFEYFSKIYEKNTSFIKI
jgi:uncharacterized membrane protein YczE